MGTLRGVGSKHPCPHCMVAEEDLWKIVSVVSEPRRDEDMHYTYRQALKQNKKDGEKTLQAKGIRRVFVRRNPSRSCPTPTKRLLQNVFWNFLYTRVYAAISWDRLHAYHGGLFSDHLFEEILNILETTDSRTKREFRTQVEEK